MEATLEKVKKVTTMPSIAELKAKEEEIATTVKGVDMALDGSKEMVTASSTDEQIEKAVETDNVEKFVERTKQFKN